MSLPHLKEDERALAEMWLKSYKPKPPSRPTIAELQAILDATDYAAPVEITPDGSVGVGVSESDIAMLSAYAEFRLSETREALAAEEDRNYYHLYRESQAALAQAEERERVLRDALRRALLHDVGCAVGGEGQDPECCGYCFAKAALAGKETKQP